MRLINSVRSALSLLGIMLWFVVPGLPYLYLAIVPATWIWPRKRPALVSSYMKFICGGILAILRLGGARFTRTGRIPTLPPSLVLMNHQSLVDILTVTLMAKPHVPAFVTRVRYSRFIPLVSPCIRLLGCPVIDPREPRKALSEVREKTRSQERAILVFPEGHRTTDGEIQPFRAGGTQAVLGARRMPVYLVVTDGLWQGRRFVDFVFNVHLMRGTTEVLGPFAPPEREEDVPAFLERMRETMIARLRERRSGAAAA